MNRRDQKSEARKFDRSYFDRWYRDPRHRVGSGATTRRRVAMVVAVAEYFLERPIRSVLDVGCGEGQWQPLLAALRPRLRYTGVDSSEYAIARFGRRRNLFPGTFGALAELPLASSYDLVVCSNVLAYVDRSELLPGLGELARRTGGVAFLEAYDSGLELDGDAEGLDLRSTKFYRAIFRRAGFTPCGPHCYAGPTLGERVTALEAGR